MHRWGASVFIILMFFHMARVFLFGAYKYPRELNWIIGVILLATGMFEGFTGYLLPWDQTAYWASVVGININGTGPIVGPFLAAFLRGAEIGPDTLAASTRCTCSSSRRADLRADRAAPLPRGPPRRLAEPVDEGGRRLGARRAPRRRPASSQPAARARARRRWSTE